MLDGDAHRFYRRQCADGWEWPEAAAPPLPPPRDEADAQRYELMRDGASFVRGARRAADAAVATTAPPDPARASASVGQASRGVFVRFRRV